MGIYINGMDMPKDKPLTLVIYPDGTVANVYEEQRGTAVPVPSHGRLIDADALEAHGDCLSKLHVDYDAPAGHRIWRECVPFDDIPTVIPAEEAVT